VVTVCVAASDSHHQHFKANQSILDLKKKYLKRGENYGAIEGVGLLIKTRKKLFVENADHNLLPESEENSDFDGEELKQCRIWSEWFTQSMVEKHKIVKRI
jgi:hypothetical protein